MTSGWNPNDIKLLRGLIWAGSHSTAWKMAPQEVKDAAIKYYKEQKKNAEHPAVIQAVEILGAKIV